MSNVHRLIARLVIPVLAYSVAWQVPNSANQPTIDEPGSPNINLLRIGPVTGLTSTWHFAPPATSIPLGTLVQFHQPKEAGEVVLWSGADEVSSDETGSTAEVMLASRGVHTVVATVMAGNVTQYQNTCDLEVLDLPVDAIEVTSIEIWVDPVEIDETLPPEELNQITMEYFFGGSIAELREVGRGAYRTSIGRRGHMRVDVDPPGFEPLIEWREDGVGIRLGGVSSRTYTSVGEITISAGPLDHHPEIALETYRVTVVGHDHLPELIPEGEPVTFTAVTDPPGYEAEITWLASTKYGTATPVLGSGPTFTVQFDDTWGVEEGGVPFQWIGAKADHAFFNQDPNPKPKKNPPPCLNCVRCCGGDITFGNPVYLFSGECLESAVDLQIKGRGMDFVWSRKYRSRFGQSTAQGNGWDFSYNIRVEPNGDDLVLFEGNARLDLYTLQPDGTWTAPEFFRVIEQNPDDSCTLTFADTGTWDFHPLDHPDAPGKISAITDRNGNALTFDYDGQGRLVAVHDTLDTPDNPRGITIAYNPQGFIKSITDFIDRTVEYDYYLDGDADGSAGDLKSVTTPAVTGTPNGNDFPFGKTTIYTYSTGLTEPLNHNLLTITDPKVQTYLTNVYEETGGFSFDRVVRQVWGDPGDIIDFVYVPVAPTENNIFAVSKVIVNDRVGNVKEYFIDAGNRTVIFREYTGRAPDPDAPTTETDNRPIDPLRPDDPEFFETRWEYNDDSLPIRIIHPNLNEEIFTYDEGNDSRRSQGNLLKHCRLPILLGGDQEQICEQYEYDDEFGGCCGTNFVTKHTDARGNITTHMYDPNGNRTHTDHRIESIVEDFEYNAFGQMIQHQLPDNGINGNGCRRVDVFDYYDEGDGDGTQNGYRKNAIIDASGGDSCPGDHFDLTTTYEYDAVGNMVRVIDPRDHDTLYEFNQLDQVVREISRVVELPNHGDNPQPFHYERDTFYDANDNVVRIDIQNLDEDGNVPNDNTHFSMIYDYEILNYRDGMAQEFGDADLDNDVLEIGDIPVGDFDQFIVTEYKYDENRNRTLVRYGEATNDTDPFNLVRTLYDERDLTFREIRADGDDDQSTTQYDYDPNRNLKRTAQGLQDTPRITTNTYDGYDRMVSSTDPMGNVTEYHYDPNSNVGGDREPGEPNPFGTLVSGELIDVEGSAGNVRLSQMTYVYDEMDRRTRAEVEFFDTETQDPIGDGQSVTETQYTDNSQVSQVTNDNAHATTTVYDTANRVLTVTDAKGNTVTYQYDENSNVKSVLEFEKNDLPDQPDEEFTTTNEYDNLDRLISTTDNLGNTSEDAVGNTNRYQYDSRDNQTLMIDALGNVVRYAYDGINRLIATTRELTDTGDGDGNVIDTITTTQEWDDTSRLVEQADDNGNATMYTYDPLNRMVKETYADATVHAYTYDVHHNRLTMTDANGSVATCTYDLLDRLTIKTIDLAPGIIGTTHESYHYDGLSRLVIAKDNDSGVLRSHDSLSRVTREILNGQTTTCVYDGVGNQTQCTYPGGRVISCDFDDLERKEIISDGDSLIAEYHYVGPGRVTRRIFGNGTQTDYTYDGITGIPNEPSDFGVKQIVRTKHSLPDDPAVIVDDRTYTWDRMYNKTQRKDVRAGGPQLTHDYTYDSIYRLLRTVATDSMGDVLRDEQYDLDGVGNRTKVMGGNNPGQYVLDENDPPADFQMNQYTTTPREARAYDLNGNLINLNDPGDPPPLATVQYDYRNQMVSYVDPFTGVMAEYAYDTLGRRIAKAVTQGGMPQTTSYFYDGWQVVEEHNEFGATQATYVYGLYIDEVLNMQREGSDFFYHTDDLYNVMGVTDAAGSVVERYEYADYGQPVDIFTIEPIIGDPSAIGNPYLFTGRRYDLETGWYYYRTRYLDPAAGRFTTRDTIGMWGDKANLGNAYTYAGGNPWSRLDSTGRDTLEEIKKELREKFDEALDSVGGADTEAGKELAKVFERAKDELMKLAEKGGPRVLAKATLILDYIEFEFRVAVAILAAGGKIMHKRAACVLCLLQPKAGGTTWVGGTIKIWSWNIFMFGFNDYTVLCKCIRGRIYATVPNPDGSGDMWVPCF